jgi:hypothetical protein
MEKAILERIKTQFPHLIASKVYQTGFKEGKSTAIHASRLLNEVHGVKKGNSTYSWTYKKLMTPLTE